MPATSLPVLMHHYISRHANNIAVSPEIFEEQCKDLTNAGWRGVSLAEAESYFIRGEKLPSKSCLITFDDGYLDNYVNAWPILRQYGHYGTVFAVSARIGEENITRPTLADVHENPAVPLPDVDHPFVTREGGYTERQDAFMTWTEARRMEADGVVAVASHTFAHQGVCVSGEYGGFILPGDRPRTFDRPADFFWGYPDFPMKAGLANRAFRINPELAEKIKALVPQDEQAAHAFAQDETAVADLRALAASYADNLGRMETDAEMETRMREDIVRGKTVLEDRLGHTVRTLCWPWGEYCELSLRLGREAGFEVFITTAGGPNPPQKPLAVHRFKVRNKGGMWLRSRLWLYSHPLIASLYARSRV